VRTHIPVGGVACLMLEKWVVHKIIRFSGRSIAIHALSPVSRFAAQIDSRLADTQLSHRPVAEQTKNGYWGESIKT